MAVVNVTAATVKPDRYDDYLEKVARAAKPILEKCGATNVRLLAGLVAGQVTGSLSFIVEADDFAASGAITDKFLADPEGLAIMRLLNATAGPVESFHVTMWVDVPL